MILLKKYVKFYPFLKSEIFPKNWLLMFNNTHLKYWKPNFALKYVCMQWFLSTVMLFCCKLILRKEIWQKIFEDPGLGVGPALGTHTILQIHF